MYCQVKLLEIQKNIQTNRYATRSLKIGDDYCYNYDKKKKVVVGKGNEKGDEYAILGEVFSTYSIFFSGNSSLSINICFNCL